MYIGWVYIRVYHGGILASLLPYVYHGGIPRLPTVHPIPPWVYHRTHLHPVYRSSCPVCSTLPGDEALGSEEKKPLGGSPCEG